jgi:hypothetical protein
MVQNRLYHVNETVAVNAFNDDIDDQGTFTQTNINSSNNYAYDREGRLIRDEQEEIADIEWTVTGKVKSVTRIANSSKKNLKFRYDAMGMRVAKEIYDSNNNWEKTTFYVRDPQGNVMGIYEKIVDQQTQNLSYKIAERNIYGSSMVGLVKSEIELISASAPSTTSFTHAVGVKQYYISNHLQSVSTAVSDLSIANDWNNDNVVDFNRAEIVSAVDFYSFGSPMQGRTINSTAVRHSMNGQEKDDEIYGEGNMTTAEFWQYDTRLGRRWNIDPRSIDDASVYSCFLNSPIYFVDLTGDTTNYYDSKTGDYLGTVYGSAALTDREIDKATYDKIVKDTYKCLKSIENIPDEEQRKSEKQDRINVEETDLNASATLIDLNSDVGIIARVVYAEMRGGDANAKSIVAESIVNRSELPVGSYENPDGTIQTIVNKAYDVTKTGNGSNDVYNNPYRYARKNKVEANAWTGSVSAALKAKKHNSNVGQGVIFYHSTSNTYFDKNSKLKKINLPGTHKGIKGTWKFK